MSHTRHQLPSFLKQRFGKRAEPQCFRSVNGIQNLVFGRLKPISKDQS